MLGATAMVVLLLHSPVVIDGDTISGTIENIPEVFGKNISVRLAGIDTAEVHSHCDNEAILAKQAVTRVKELLGNAKEVEIRNPQRDKYFRLVGDVVIDGISVNATLLHEALARPYSGGTKRSWCR